MALGNGSTTTAANGGVTVPDNKAPVVNGTNMETLPRQTKQDPNTAFLRAARAGQLDKIQEYLDSGTVRDINSSNANGLNALHLAAKDGHVEVVQELLKRGAIVDAATKKGNTALHIASLAGQEEVVRMLIQHGASINVQSQNGFTPLYMASQENHDGCVKYLLAKGGNQTLATEDGFTPLAVAMQQGHDKVVAVLLENDTRGKVRLPALHIAAKKDDCKAAALLLQNEHNPDITSKSGFTPLHIAAHYGNDRVASLLYERGAQVNYQAKHNITPLHVASKWGKQAMVGLLVAKGADVQARTRDGLTPLHCAARSGHDQVVDMLLENGAPMHSKTKNGLAPLHMAAQGEHVDAARILLYHGAPVDEVTVDYLTALHVAAHCGHVRVAKLLLDRGADPNARALNGFTPLHIACKKNRIKMVELLLKHGASIGATTESGLTPLHVASFMGCMNIVIYLLQHEASPDIPTVRGETPLHLAARANQTDIIRILLRNGAAVDAKAREEQTPLHVASRLGNVDIVMLLVQHGANPHATTKDLYTPLHIAAKEGQEEVASVLLDNGASHSATTKKGFTPLHLAAKYGHLNVARLLLQRDAGPDAAGKNGVTPLHVAAHYDHQPVALLLLDKGASPHATAKNGHTPLHIAAKKNQMDIATTLLEYGAQADTESKAGFTPLHLSAQEGHSDMSSLLLEHQANPNHSSKNGLTPLHLSAQEDRVPITQLLLRAGADRDMRTKAGYTPLHVACHHGHVSTVRLLLEHGADVNPATGAGYTPLHQAAQQGHVLVISLLLKHRADPNALTHNGQTALGIANKLGYISVVEELKVVTEVNITTTTTVNIEEKYKVVVPEAMQETYMSDSEDEGGEDTLADQQQYKYMTVDDMKSLGDDSMRMDVTNDEKSGDFRNSMAPSHVSDFIISPQHAKEYYATNPYTVPDNIDINRQPITVGIPSWRNFLVSFLVDARGGAMRGCRHSGVRVIVPPRCAGSPTRITCRYVRPKRMPHPPPLMEGEALASRVLELGPVAAKFLGPVIIEVPHFASLRGKQREIIVLRSDNGETWKEHTLESSEEAIQDVLNHSFEGEELSQIEDLHTNRITRILTNDFPHYFAVVSRVRQEVHAIGPDGGTVSSSAVPMVQAVFPPNALTKKIRVGLQAQAMEPDMVSKLLGHGVAVSPIVTVEPRRRKFHKAISLSLPAPRAHSQGMINQYSGSAPTLRLLCSIMGGQNKAVWEDVTGSTPLTFVKDCVSFTTTVSARFWLMDCRNITDSARMATELYTQAAHVPFMAKFVVFAKRISQLEARVRVFCMTDDKEDKTLEHQENFTEIAKSKDVEVLEGKDVYMEFAGNLIPILQSGDQPKLDFKAFRENRLAFTMRLRDQDEDPVGRIVFMNDPKVVRGEPTQTPLCTLNLVLPKDILPGRDSQSDLLSIDKDHSYLQHGGISAPDTIHRADFRLSDICAMLGEDWAPLAQHLDIPPSDIELINDQYGDETASHRAMVMFRLWLRQKGEMATGNGLEQALKKIGRHDIVQKSICNIQLVTDDMEQAVAKVRLDQSGFDELREELGPSRDASLRRDAKLEIFNNDIDDDITVTKAEGDTVGDLSQDELSEKNDDGIDPLASITDKDVSSTLSSFIAHKSPPTITNDNTPPNNNQRIGNDNDAAALAQITMQLNRLQSIPKGTGDANGNTPPPSPAVFGLDNVNERHVFGRDEKFGDIIEAHAHHRPLEEFIRREATTLDSLDAQDTDTSETELTSIEHELVTADPIANLKKNVIDTLTFLHQERNDFLPVDDVIVPSRKDDHVANDIDLSVIDVRSTIKRPDELDLTEHIYENVDVVLNQQRAKIDCVEDIIEAATVEVSKVIEEAEDTVNENKQVRFNVDHREDTVRFDIGDNQSKDKTRFDIEDHKTKDKVRFDIGDCEDDVEFDIDHREDEARFDIGEYQTKNKVKFDIRDCEDDVEFDIDSHQHKDNVRFDIGEQQSTDRVRFDIGEQQSTDRVRFDIGEQQSTDKGRFDIRAIGFDIDDYDNEAQIRSEEAFKFLENELASSPIRNDLNEFLQQEIKAAGKSGIPIAKSRKQTAELDNRDDDCTSPINESDILSKIPVSGGKGGKIKTIKKHSKDPLKEFVKLSENVNWDDDNDESEVRIHTMTTTTTMDPVVQTITRIITTDNNNSSKIPILQTETTTTTIITELDSPTKSKIPILTNQSVDPQLISPGSKASKSSTLDSDSDSDSAPYDVTGDSAKELKSILKKRKKCKGAGLQQVGSGGSVDGGRVGGGLRTIGSSSGSDIALHEAGAEPSDDESEDFYQTEPHFTETVVEEIDPVTGSKLTRTVRTMSQSVTSPGAMSADELRNSMQTVMDKFMSDERQPQ